MEFDSKFLKKYYSGDNIKVAIIDNGVHLDAEKFNITHIQLVKEQQKENNINFHGTLCAELMLQTAPNIELFDLDINDNGVMNEERIIRAIDICLEESIDIISISLGLKDYSYILERKCEKAHSNGIIILAADANDNSIAFPSALHSVLKVSIDASHNSVIQSLNGTVSVCEKVLFLNQKQIKMTGNSSACAYMAGLMALYLESRILQPRELLIQDIFSYEKVSTIDEEIVYPLLDTFCINSKLYFDISKFQSMIKPSFTHQFNIMNESFVPIKKGQPLERKGGTLVINPTNHTTMPITT